MMKNAYFPNLLLLVCSLTLVACSAKSGSGYSDVSIRTNPYDGETGVETSIVIKAAFSRDMLSTSIDTSSFSLSSSVGSVSGTVNFDGTYNSASFTPSSSLTFSTEYTASLSSAITDDYGTGITSFSWTFTTSAGGWGTAELIESDNSGGADNAQVAMNDSGNAVAVWAHFDGIRYNIWANYYTAGSGWGTAEKIETDDMYDALYPQVAIDSSGNVIAVWQQKQTADTLINVWSNRYTVGSGWGTNQLLDSEEAGDVYNPVVAIDANGNAMVVWAQFDGSWNNIWANRYVSGSGWTTATVIESNNISPGGNYPEIAFDSSGNAIVVWYENDGSWDSIYSNYYTVDVGWGASQLIESGNAGGALNPQIAVSSSGNAIAVWHQSDGAVYNIVANRYTAGSGWGTEEKIETDDVGDALDPEVVIDSSDNAIAVWNQTDGTRTNIIANHYTTLSGWGTAAKIEYDDAGDALGAIIALDSSSNAIVVWYQSDGTVNNIWANRYSVNSGWGSAELLETDDTGSAMDPEIVINSSGIGMAVWYQFDGTRNNIWANKFE